MLVAGLEDAEDLLSDISIEDMVKNLPTAARAIEFESSRGEGAKMVKKTKEHFDAEKNLRGKDDDELKMAKKELTKHRRRYRARRIMQEVQKVMKNTNACHKLYCENEGSEELKTMSVIMQRRASSSNGKAVGVDGISAEILKSIPWRALQKIKKAFEMRYTGENKEDIETWLRNIIVLIPKKVIG